jgi:drug/metabolite transporter (DMT)-like permease
LPEAKSYVPLVVLSVIWGMAFVAIRRADFELSPVNLTLMRWLIVSAGFLVIYPFVVKPKARLEAKDIPRLALVSLCGVVIYHLALNTAESLIDASLAGLLISIAPLTVVLLSSLVLHERIRTRLWAALVIAVAGSVLISVPYIVPGSTTLDGPPLVVAAALASATYTISSKPLTTKYGPSAVAAWSAFLGTAMLLPLVSPSLLSQAEALSAYGWGSVLYLSLLSTVLANIIYFTLVSRHPLSRLGVQLYLVPLVSAVGGVVILGETLGALALGGGALLLVAVGLATSGHH